MRYSKDGRVKLTKRVSGVIADLQQRYLDNQAFARGQLSKLRHAISGAPGNDPEVWDVVAKCLPKELVGRDDEGLTPGEWAAYIAVTLFAVHQQSLEKPMHQRTNAKEAAFHGLGHAVNELVYKNKKNQQGEELESGEMPRRFSALVTAESVEEVAHYARQIVQQLRSAEIPLDYGKLAGLLYDFQFSDHRYQVRLEWSRQFAKWRPQQEEIE
jgi:CRISPR system Cascade subunit CasB